MHFYSDIWASSFHLGRSKVKSRSRKEPSDEASTAHCVNFSVLTNVEKGEALYSFFAPLSQNHLLTYFWHSA